MQALVRVMPEAPVQVDDRVHRARLRRWSGGGSAGRMRIPACMCRLSDSRICRFLPRGRPRAGAGRHPPWGGQRHLPQSARRQAARGHWGGSATSRRSPCLHGCGKRWRGYARAAGMTRDVIPSRRWGEGRGGRGRGRMRPCRLRRRCPFDRRAGGAGAGNKKRKKKAAASRPRPAGRPAHSQHPGSRAARAPPRRPRCPARLLAPSSASPASLFLPSLHSIVPRTKCALARFVS